MTHKLALEGKTFGARFILMEASGPKEYLVRFGKKESAEEFDRILAKYKDPSAISEDDLKNATPVEEKTEKPKEVAKEPEKPKETAAKPAEKPEEVPTAAEKPKEAPKEVPKAEGKHLPSATAAAPTSSGT